jgi:signal transduction histidine kinase/CheY-like chemotaxis protein
VPPGAKAVEIHYSALSYLAPEKVLFKYRLRGFETDWVEAGTRRFAYYTNLKPGNYEFQVIACNNDGVWNETGDTVAFQLLPHLYQTWWCPLAGLSLLGALLWFAHGFRVNQLKAHEQELRQRVVEEVQKVKVSKDVEVALLEANRAKDEANRAKDDFIATLSHELRTPLTPVLMIAASHESDLTVPPAIREQFSLIRHNVELETRLIDDLLDLTRIARAKFSIRKQRLDVHELLSRVTGLLSEDASRKQLSITATAAARKTVVDADPDRLLQVLWNLLQNAIKFTPDGGRIEFRTFNPNDKSILIQVRDSGLGISPQSMQKIFIPFEQGVTSGDHRYGGLGLGLSICKTIVELHQGSITAASEGLHRGAIFTVSLPLVEGEEAPPRPLENTPPEPNSHWRILLVEDHEPTRSILSRLLSRDGHHVEAAACHAAAEVLIHANLDHPFDLLISDLGLPDGSGLTLVTAIKAVMPEITAVAISGYGAESDIRNSIEAGFHAHLVKPISIEHLKNTLVSLRPGPGRRV